MYKTIKRVLDFITCLVIGVVALPFVLLVAIIMSFHFRGNPFFVQNRLGRGNKPFKIIKLKSMTNERDKDGNLLPNEQRLTNMGLWLRRTSIDELPQLVNVIIGDMSLIGPRPMGTNYLNLLSKEQKRRHILRPGLTGWAQINGRDEVTPTEKFKMDVWYVDNINFTLDFKILMKTFITVFKRVGVDERATDENFPDNGNYNTNLSEKSD